MSGGSYNYVCFWEAPYALIDNLSKIAIRLNELGYRGAADETFELIEKMKINPHLRNAWRAVEWLDSGDWGEETARHNIEDAGWRRYHTREKHTHDGLLTINPFDSNH